MQFDGVEWSPLIDINFSSHKTADVFSDGFRLKLRNRRAPKQSLDEFKGGWHRRH